MGEQISDAEHRTARVICGIAGMPGERARRLVPLGDADQSDILGSDSENVVIVPEDLSHRPVTKPRKVYGVLAARAQAEAIVEPQRSWWNLRRKAVEPAAPAESAALFDIKARVCATFDPARPGVADWEILEDTSPADLDKLVVAATDTFKVWSDDPQLHSYVGAADPPQPKSERITRANVYGVPGGEPKPAPQPVTLPASSGADRIVSLALRDKPQEFALALANNDAGRRVRMARSSMARDIGRNLALTAEKRVAHHTFSPENVAVVNRWVGQAAEPNTQNSHRSSALSVLDIAARLPWNEPMMPPPHDLSAAREILESGHSCMDKTVREVLDIVAGMVWWRDYVERTGDVDTPPPPFPMILMYGPPGCGKTTLGESIAQALGRSFDVLKCGGMSDSQELKGFLPTYIGAEPGQIIAKLANRGTSNAVLFFDEIDKMGNSNVHGNPAAALMEITDRAQIRDFKDRFLDGMSFDLSKTLMIFACNSLENIHPALLDRVTLVEVPGYSEAQKATIAEKHLIPRTLKEELLTPEQFNITEEGLRTIIRDYTRESGVRTLESRLRTMAHRMQERLSNGMDAGPIGTEQVRDLLGGIDYELEPPSLEGDAGSATALFVDSTTGTGGVMAVEASLQPGKGELIMTGTLKEMWTETCRVARTYAALPAVANWWRRNVGTPYPAAKLRTHDLHFHAHRIGQPKDGPSAGVPTTMAIISALTGLKLKPGVAMTGEITPSGAVLAVGGVPEKVLAAHRLGAHTVLIPWETRAAIAKLPGEVRDALNIVPIRHIEQALEQVFEKPLKLTSKTKSGRKSEVRGLSLA